MLSTVFAATPVDIGRDEARERAARELAERIYADAEPSWWQRASSWAWRQLGDLLEGAGNAVNGIGWVLLLALVVISVVVIIAVKTGAIQRQRRATGAVIFDEAVRSASDHRARAERAGDEEHWGIAVIEAFRAVARRLEERGTLDRKLGRTADETAFEAGHQLPGLRDALVEAARSFDAVAYGDRPGTAAEYEQILRLDDDVRRNRLVFTA